jgi:hypothetical protein
MGNHENHEMTRKGELGLAKLAAFLQTHLQAGLPMAYQKLRSIRYANDPALALALDCG